MWDDNTSSLFDLSSSGLAKQEPAKKDNVEPNLLSTFGDSNSLSFGQNPAQNNTGGFQSGLNQNQMFGGGMNNMNNNMGMNNMPNQQQMMMMQQ